jgi:general secretion pathway protein G
VFPKNRYIATSMKITQRGFTLIEIMVVVIILALLATMVAPNIIGRVDDAKISKVRLDLQGLEDALVVYRLDNYRYPTTDQGLQALVEKPSGEDLPNWKQGGYIKRLPKDPWNRDYYYLSPGEKGDVDIYSLGADGQPGGEGPDADIGTWDLK